MATSRIVKVLRANTGARDLRTVFEDFCTMTAAAIRNRVDRNGYQAREEDYERTRTHHADLSGGVLHSAPGFPAFPIRLASEMFQRALTLAPRRPVQVWDPCCGSGHLLTVLALLHPGDISAVLGTDLDPAAVKLARKNLGLLSEQSMDARAVELRERAERLHKPAYLASAAAAARLAHWLAERGDPLSYSVARADVFDPEELRRALGERRPDIVVTDVPYGEQTSWTGPNGAEESRAC